MDAAAASTAWPRILGAGLDALSAVLGMLGTYFMARRYAPSFLSGIQFAILSAYRYLRGRGEQVRKFYVTEFMENRTIADSPADNAMGLNLLFLAFLLQLARIVVTFLLEKS